MKNVDHYYKFQTQEEMNKVDIWGCLKRICCSCNKPEYDFYERPSLIDEANKLDEEYSQWMFNQYMKNKYSNQIF